MGKVLVLVDTSPSLTKVMGRIPSGKGDENRKRIRQRASVSEQGQQQFLTELEANSCGMFRFSTRLDENYLLFNNGRNWTRDEWEEASAIPTAPPTARNRAAAGRVLRAWLTPAPRSSCPPRWREAPSAAPQNSMRMTTKLGESGFFTGTNLGSAALSLVNRELKSRVQDRHHHAMAAAPQGSPMLRRHRDAGQIGTIPSSSSASGKSGLK